MATKTWHFRGKTIAHTLTIEHAYISGKATITVDGKAAFQRARSWVDFGISHELLVDGTKCLVRVQPTLWCTFRYSLLTDGKKPSMA